MKVILRAIPYRHTTHHRAEIRQNVIRLTLAVVIYALSVMGFRAANRPAPADRSTARWRTAPIYPHPPPDTPAQPVTGWVSLSIVHHAGLFVYAGLNAPVPQGPVYMCGYPGHSLRGPEKYVRAGGSYA